MNLIELNKDEASDFYEFCIKNIKLNIENLPEEDYILKNKILKLNLNIFKYLYSVALITA